MNSLKSDVSKRFTEEIDRLQGSGVFDTLEELGEMVGKSQSTFSNIRKGGGVSFDLIDTISKYLIGFDQEYVLTGRKKLRAIHDIEEPSENYREIPIVDGEVFGTISPAMSDALALKPEAFARIPQFSKGDYAVQVSGNSMKGVINHGDWIVIKRIVNKDFIIYGECYLVITKSDNLRTVKYLNENPDDPDTLWLSPYNKEQFNSQLIPRKEILELYSVIGVFRKM